MATKRKSLTFGELVQLAIALFDKALELKRREVEALEKIAHELDHWPHGLYTGISKR